MKDSTVQLAIIGCGAVTELCHLPAARLLSEVEVVALVDTNLPRARSLAEQFDITHFQGDFDELPEGVDGVVVALPNNLHAAVTTELLNRGVPVLVEKPMALTAQEADAMVHSAENHQVPLQVGLMYRFSHGAALVKRAVEEGWLGPLKSFSMDWGQTYGWPLSSGFAFSKDRAGGGQLIDMGSHVLDLLLWWLGPASVVDYSDDSLGGVEADCTLTLVVETPSGPIPGTVALSRLRNLGTGARVVGSQLTIEYDLASPATVRLWPTMWQPQGAAFIHDEGSARAQTWDDIYAAQLRAFAESISTGAEPFVPGKDVVDRVALVEKCYAERKPVHQPWMGSAGSAWPPKSIP